MEGVLEEAAQDLGATPAETFFLVTLPLIKPGVIAGALFAFINSWINVEVSIFNSTSRLMTIPVKLFNYIQFNIDPIKNISWSDTRHIESSIPHWFNRSLSV